MTAWLKDVHGYGTHAARPAAGSEGVLYYETDTDTLFRDNGTSWNALAAGGGGGGAWTPISDQTVAGGGAATISISSIPSTYKHLFMLIKARSSANTGGAIITAQFNGDTGSNYYGALQTIYSGGSNNSFTVAGTSVAVGQCAGGTIGNAAQASTSSLWLPDYTDTVFWKTLTGTTNLFNGTGASAQQSGTFSGEWASTTALNAIVLALSAGNFVAGSRVTLWGVS